MKQFKPFASAMLKWATLMLTIGMAFNLTSCKDDNETTKPAPTITLAASSDTGHTAGQEVPISVQVDSPEGGKTLSVTVNGQADTQLPAVTLDGTTSQTIATKYKIPATAAVGTTYVIIFQVTDSKDQLSQAATFVITVASVAAKTIVEVGTDGQSFNIIANTTWTSDKIYRIHGFVRVGKDDPTTDGVGLQTTGVTLTIQPGTVIYGAAGSPGGTLIVQRGNKIDAQGTASAPIVFTSAKAPNARKAGDWGGLVICGKAKNNITAAGTGATLTIAPGLGQLEGAYGGFHGGGANSDDADNSGTLTYVRLEYAGYPINPNQEINAFTFGSVGSGTKLSYLQATYSNDDSFEWFGGTVNGDHLIAYKGLDDDFDTDNGFRGKIQFGLGIRDYNIADQSGSNGFESDNDANGTTTTPFTAAQFSNMTIIGGKQAFNTAINIQFQNVAQIRRSSKLNIINSFFTGYPNGIFWDANLGTTISSINTNDGTGFGASVVKNNILAGVEGWGGNGFGSAATTDEQSAFQLTAPGSAHPVVPRGRVVAGGTGSFSSQVFASTNAGSAQYVEQTINSLSPIKYLAANNNTLLAKWTDPTLKIDASIFEPLAATPVLKPGSGSVLLSGADFAGYTGFSVVGYKGAFDGTTDWTTGWVNWSPQGSDYSK